MYIDGVLKKCRSLLRLFDNYYVEGDTKMLRACQFFHDVIVFEFKQIEVLRAEEESIFIVLCEDIIRQCRQFLAKSGKTLEDARTLILIILSVEHYLYDIERLPWKIGQKLSWSEKHNIKRALRVKLHSAYDSKTNQPVRGTRAIVRLCGSLATGHSDWKLINGGEIPKPSDYNLPRQYRKASHSIYRKLDEDLALPAKLKPLMSDVDILIMNKVIFDSCDRHYLYTSWSYRLGEKYQTGLAGSKILGKIHQTLLHVKIAGIRGRWINYIVLCDEHGLTNYMRSRSEEIQRTEKKLGKKIKIQDVEILNEVIQ
jgi:hypothetical protein